VLAALPCGAQSVPAFNVTDMWFDPAEPGSAVTLVHSGASNQVYALWHLYDPRAPEPATANANDFKPSWIVMTGGTWTTPTHFEGDAYITGGTDFRSPWVPQDFRITRVGRFALDFSSFSRGTFTYDIAPPGGLASTDPAFGLPAASGAKPIQRFDF
jgi:hypothetical protein